MIVRVIEDPAAGERNSWGFFILKDADGRIHFGCEEHCTKTTSIRAAMDWNGSTVQDWTEWRYEDGLQPAKMADIEQAGLSLYVTGELDTETSLWVWRRESDHQSL